MPTAQPKTGLILTGGGARAAYQVGVLRAVAELREKGAPNPFPIICGTSAGPVNAAALATFADDFRRGGFGRLRVGRPGAIPIEHLLAWSAIPFIFPAVRIGDEFFGDGSMRQVAPLSPALHLGADRVLVIAVGRLNRELPVPSTANGYPSFAQIAGHALSSIFLDSLEADLERLQRINRTVSVMHE